MVIKSWSLLTAAGLAFLLLGAGLIWFVLHLLRSNRGDLLASAGLAGEQEINLPSPGAVVVLLETPRTASDFREFQIELTEKQTGRAVKMKYEFATAQGAVYALKTMKVPFGRMTAPRAGPYVVRVSGLRDGKDYSDYRLMLSRPYLGRMVFQIIGIVICGVGMLLSVIWAAWLAGLLKPGETAAVPAVQPTSGVPGKTIDLETWKRQQQPRK